MPEIDISVDGSVRVYGDGQLRLGRSELPTHNFRSTTGLPVDILGLANWTIGMVTARFIKLRIRLDTTDGVPYIKGKLNY